LWISGPAHEHVRKALPLPYEDLGPHQVKNIAEPITAFAVRVRAEASPIADAPTSLPLPSKRSIAVLPFKNMSGDPEQEYFVDGMVEEITAALSRIRFLFVIARFTAERYPQAVHWLRRGIEERPSAVWAHRLLAPAYALAGQLDEARRSAAQLLHVHPNYSITKDQGNFVVNPRFRDRFIKGLRMAGVPE
jgi:adenylate cyclase